MELDLFSLNICQKCSSDTPGASDLTRTMIVYDRLILTRLSYLNLQTRNYNFVVFVLLMLSEDFDNIFFCHRTCTRYTFLMEKIAAMPRKTLGVLPNFKLE